MFFFVVRTLRPCKKHLQDVKKTSQKLHPPNHPPLHPICCLTMSHLRDAGSILVIPANRSKIHWRLAGPNNNKIGQQKTKISRTMPFLNHATLHQNDISVGFDMAKGMTWEISRSNSSSLPIAVVSSRSSFFFHSSPPLLTAQKDKQNSSKTYHSLTSLICFTCVCIYSKDLVSLMVYQSFPLNSNTRTQNPT